LTALVSLLIISAHAGCNRLGTAAGDRQTGTAEPRIQRRQDGGTDKVDAPNNGDKSDAKDGPDSVGGTKADDTAVAKADGSKGNGEAAVSDTDPKDASKGGATATPGGPADLPKIHLSEQHRATCLLKQGDAIPDARLPDLDGDEKQLSALYGEKLTVLCFWTGTSPIAEWQLSDLGPDVVDIYGESGVNVIAINYKETAEEAKKVAESAEVAFPVLLDLKGELFAKVATQYLPRTYLLDSDGKILWFDIGYASETRRHLNEAVRHGLSSQ
jgi:peroxiredoxin